jgi:hypothetical protein
MRRCQRRHHKSFEKLPLRSGQRQASPKSVAHNRSWSYAATRFLMLLSSAASRVPSATRMRTTMGRPLCAGVAPRIGETRANSAPIVFFALMSNRAYNNVVADDLEKDDVAKGSERDDQLARATAAQFCASA